MQPKMRNDVICAIYILILFLSVKCLNGAEDEQRKNLESVSNSNRTKDFPNHESQQREKSQPSGMHPTIYLRSIFVS